MNARWARTAVRRSFSSFMAAAATAAAAISRRCSIGSGTSPAASGASMPAGVPAASTTASAHSGPAAGRSQRVHASAAIPQDAAAAASIWPLRSRAPSRVRLSTFN